jgi:hypothetical protein
MNFPTTEGAIRCDGGRQNNTIAIVGRGKTSKFTPWDNPDVDIWGMNDNAMNFPRLDASLEMHTDALVTDRYNVAKGYVDWLREPHPFPIWMHFEHPAIPSSRGYPRNAINAMYSRHLWRGGREQQDLYTSSMPYAIALAIYQRYSRIELYGIDLAGVGEYAKYADLVLFWIGKATGLGIDVIIPDESPLLQGLKLYGVL